VPRPAGLVRRGWESIIVCASGPSFSEAQAARIARARPAWRVIVVNDNWRRVPTADLLYACDQRYWDHYIATIRACGFAGELWTQAAPAARKYGLRCVEHVRRAGLTRTGFTVHGGGNSGYQAINLAYLLGADRIALVGFDMRAGPGGQHWFGEHPTEKLARKLPFKDWRARFAPLASDLRVAGVDVVNCSPGSALTCFPEADLDTVLS
jgi:hypothetical protein